MNILCRLLGRDHRLAIATLLGIGLLTPCCVLDSHAQEQPRLVRPTRAARQTRSNPPAPVRQTPIERTNERKNERKVEGKAVDPTVWPLLLKMFRPQVSYEATEVSTIVANGMSSEELIQGDKSGRTRREYLSPGQLKGNIILTTPNQFYHYKSQEDRLYLALWPVELVDKAARLREMARNGRVRIQLTGGTMVAGRTAKQITIWSAGGSSNGAVEGDEARRVLDLDADTGILLQATRYDSAGHLISTTSLRNVNVGATLDPSRFDPKSLPNAKDRVPLFPEGQPMFQSVDQARSQVPFTIKEPTLLPAGYALDGVWVFGAKSKRPSILLRYSSGVSHFSLFENLVPPNPTGAAQLLRPNELKPRRTLGGWSWRTLVPEGQLNLLYTGYLPDAQQKALWSALQ